MYREITKNDSIVKKRETVIYEGVNAEVQNKSPLTTILVSNDEARDKELWTFLDPRQSAELIGKWYIYNPSYIKSVTLSIMEIK